MEQYTGAPLQYAVEITGEGILFKDRGGARIALIKGGGLKSESYSILDSNNSQIGFLKNWSTPSLAISNMPLYSSSSIIKLYEREGGPEIERMALSAQSINSTKMNLSLLNKRDSVIAFLSETTGPYLIRDAGGHQFGSLSKTDSTGRCEIIATMPSGMPETVVVKLVAGLLLFNALTAPS